MAEQGKLSVPVLLVRPIQPNMPREETKRAASTKRTFAYVKRKEGIW